MDRFDQVTLLEWLALHDAPDEVIARVGEGLHALGPETLDPEGIYLVLCGALAQATEPYVSEDKVDALKALATQLGYDEAHFEGLLSYTLRIKERRLRAYAVLGLSLDATPAEVKLAHRQLAKTFHPDRARALGPKEFDRATRMLARLNEARALLLQSVDGVSLHGEDDLSLDEFRFEEGEDVASRTPILDEERPERARLFEPARLPELTDSLEPGCLPSSEDAPTEEYSYIDDDFTELWDDEEPSTRAQRVRIKFVTTGR